MHSLCLCSITLAAVGAVFAAVESETARLSPEERRQIEAAVPGKASAIPKAARRLLVVTLDRWNGEIRKGHASDAHGN